jgi:hypothetical protein
MQTQDIERLARKRAGAKMGWFIHATVYVLVNLVLGALSFSLGHHWAVFPFVGWGLGLAIHGVVVFLVTGDLHQRLIERERLALQRDPW